MPGASKRAMRKITKTIKTGRFIDRPLIVQRRLLIDTILSYEDGLNIMVNFGTGTLVIISGESFNQDL
jgi:hypothetical protein